jgi:hypothetical protein
LRSASELLFYSSVRKRGVNLGSSLEPSAHRVSAIRQSHGLFLRAYRFAQTALVVAATAPIGISMQTAARLRT